MSPLKVCSAMPAMDIANNETVGKVLTFFQQTLSVYAVELKKGELTPEIKERAEQQMLSFFNTMISCGRMVCVPKFSIKQTEPCQHHSSGMIGLMIEPNEFRKCLGLPESKSILYEEIYPILQ